MISLYVITALKDNFVENVNNKIESQKIQPIRARFSQSDFYCFEPF